LYSQGDSKSSADASSSSGVRGRDAADSSSKHSKSVTRPVIFFQNTVDAVADGPSYSQCVRLFPNPPSISTAKKNRTGFSHCFRLDFNAPALCTMSRDGTLTQEQTLKDEHKVMDLMAFVCRPLSS
jgi:hypothetical protein